MEKRIILTAIAAAVAFAGAGVLLLPSPLVVIPAALATHAIVAFIAVGTAAAKRGLPRPRREEPVREPTVVTILPGQPRRGLPPPQDPQQQHP